LSSAAVLPRRWTLALAGVAAITGLFGVMCSALLYAATRRPLWRLDRTAARFGFTMAGTGGTSVALASGVAGHDPSGARLGAWVAVVGLAGGLVLAAGFLIRHRGRPSALGRSVRLMSDALGTRTRRSIALCSVALAAGSIGLALPFGGSANLAWAVAWMGAVGGAWLERSLFFRAASPDRMPGTQKSGTQK
jgi:DMSO reductase anchor subunit